MHTSARAAPSRARLGLAPPMQMQGSAAAEHEPRPPPESARCPIPSRADFGGEAQRLRRAATPLRFPAPASVPAGRDLASRGRSGAGTPHAIEPLMHTRCGRPQRLVIATLVALAWLS